MWAIEVLLLCGRYVAIDGGVVSGIGGLTHFSVRLIFDKIVLTTLIINLLSQVL